MRCSSCGFENASGIQFCSECGRKLEHVSVPIPDPRSYTPKHLVEKILTSRSALEGERKQVTILFADVRGSMDLSETTEPENWHGLWSASDGSMLWPVALPPRGKLPGR
jgi:zinc-ribbon domain